MVFSRNTVYKHQHPLGDSTAVNKGISKCKDINRGLLEELAPDRQVIFKQQELFRSLAELSPCPIAIASLESGEILFQNQLAESILGVESYTTLEKFAFNCYDYPYSWQRLIDKLENGECVRNFPILFKKNNGDAWEVRISAQVVNWEDKLVALFVFMNTTEQKTTQQINAWLGDSELGLTRENTSDIAENYTYTEAIGKISALVVECQQLKTRLHLMERALAASSNGIILTDANLPDNPIVYANPAFEKMTGYCAREVIGRNCRFLQGTDRKQAAIAKLRAAVQQQKECHVIIRNYRKDGSLFWNELYIAPVFDAFGKLTHFIGIQTDITERVKAVEALQEREEQYRRIVETATEGIWVIDQDNKTTFVNQQMASMLGYTVEEMIGQSLFSFMDAQQRELANTLLARRRQGVRETHDFKFCCKDGSDLWAMVSCAPLFDEQGNYTGALGMVTNITDRKRVEAALQESKQRLDSILHSLEDVIWSIDAVTFETLYLNSSVVKVYGRPASDFFQNSNLWFEVIHPEDQPRVKAAIEALLTNGNQELEYRIIRPDGQVRWLLNRSHLIYDASGKAIRIEGIATDITDRKRMEKKLVRYAFYDALTGLPNRVLFMERLQQAIARMKNSPGDLFAVLFLDLDRFKIVNDSLGHCVGDRLLVTLAQRLQSCLHPDDGDVVARLGGDEFTILLSHVQSVDDAIRVAEHIHQVLKSPFNLNGYQVFTTVSIGIALGTNGYTQAADVLRDADTALYRAKEQGKAWHIVFDSTMYDRAVALLHLETDLRWALQRQELRVFYQPIVSLVTGNITGFEALVRWQHPQRRLVSPNDFIAIAEETGLIVPIGQWVLRESCLQLRQWQLKFPEHKSLSINVNLSGKQLSQHNLVEQINQILQETSLAPSSLKLEITESAIMASPEKAASVLQRLKALGIQLCIDDFGTGYSSLAYLHHFPIDILKIDRSFINRIDSDGDQWAIVRAIITLAGNLGMGVVAEGVETMDQLIQLRLLECDKAQGYLFSQPLDSEQASALLVSQPFF